ncbi:MAG: DUF523 and DUF1722 domain-containing protein [Spirochaetes bacterium]|nr:DUF523 and DUF1722 domain-containing protein [Spirochaetota bacterium]
MQFPTPTICVSACLNGQNVRYNGQTIHDEFVSSLLKFCHSINVCPEIAIGLGVPRDRILVYYDNGQCKLFQPGTGKDVTHAMHQFAKSHLEALHDIDGFILKAKSPSCGISGTKIYKDSKGTIFHSKGKGLFAMHVLERFDNIPCEDEGRLRDEEIREHFLVRIFTFADIRQTFSKNPDIQSVIQFHQNYKYILMTYNQKKLAQLGRIVASYTKGQLNTLINEYRDVFVSAFRKKPSHKQHVNTLLHIFGYFSDKLNVNEKKHFLHLIDKYSKNKIRRNVLTELLLNWAHRFNDSYLLSQKYLSPYPEELAMQ